MCIVAFGVCFCVVIAFSLLSTSLPPPKKKPFSVIDVGNETKALSCVQCSNPSQMNEFDCSNLKFHLPLIKIHDIVLGKAKTLWSNWPILPNGKFLPKCLSSIQQSVRHWLDMSKSHPQSEVSQRRFEGRDFKTEKHLHAVYLSIPFQKS